MTNANGARPGEKFDRLVEIMALLRSPGGCPWDREQTFQSLRKYLLEETYEVLESIDAQAWDELAEELGDLILQPVFLAQMAAEEQRFTIADSLDAILAKLIRRHPHVFGEAEARTAEDVKHRWDQIKAGEKAEKGRQCSALLDGVPRALPALVEAQEIGVRAASVGFDWPSADEVLEKLHEELEEIAQARAAGGDPARLQDEVGDLLFVVVNLARFLKVDAEQALRGANAKFRRRFAFVEQALKEKGIGLEGATLEQMEEKWQQAKRNP